MAKKKAKSRPKPALLHRKMRVAHKTTRKASLKHAGSRSGGDYTKYSGKFTVRLPKSLHQALVVRAEREGVSLNLFVTNALSRTVAMPSKK